MWIETHSIFAKKKIFKRNVLEVSIKLREATLYIQMTSPTEEVFDL